MNKFLFILSPTFSGSTLLHQLLATSENVSAIPGEGLFMPEVRHYLPSQHWDVPHRLPWASIRQEWMKVWDTSKPILVEKSPPAIMHAEDIQEHFDPVYFIALIRNPYAFCEGHHRRRGLGYRFAAERWVLQARHQQRNIDKLQNLLHIGYEELADHPGDVANRILNFLPELESIDVEAHFQVQAVDNAWRRGAPIKNLNKTKIALLSAENVEEINEVLVRHDDLLDCFDYQIVDPAAHVQERSNRASLSVSIVRAKYFLKRFALKSLRALRLERVFPRKMR